MKFAAIALALILLTSGCVVQKSTETLGVSWDLEYSRKDVQFATSDGLLINGSIYSSVTQGKYPVVILVHQEGGDRHDWDNFVPFLVHAGYSALAYDSRGAGESITMANGTIYVRPGSYYDDMSRDVEAAIGFLSRRNTVDVSRLAVVGSLAGADVAYSASSLPQIKTTAVISPSAGALSANARSVFFLADDTGYNDALVLYEKTAEPRKIQEYGGAGRGIMILDRTDAKSDVIDWLQKTL